jgi:hypothetical protein
MSTLSHFPSARLRPRRMASYAGFQERVAGGAAPPRYAVADGLQQQRINRHFQITMYVQDTNGQMGMASGLTLVDPGFEPNKRYFVLYI